MSCGDAKLSLINKVPNINATKNVNGIERFIVNQNKNINPYFFVIIKDRFETTLHKECPIIGFNIAKVVEKKT